MCYVSALTLLVGRQEGYLACKKTEWWDAGMVICLGWGADLHMAQLMPLPLSVKSRLVLVLRTIKRMCVCVYVCVRACVCVHACVHACVM